MVQFTALNTMVGGRNIDEMLDWHVEWGITCLDLKGKLYGKAIEQLSIAEAVALHEKIQARHLSVYCLSTSIFHEQIEKGYDYFRATYFSQLENTIEVAKVLQPKLIRLLAAVTKRRAEIDDSIPYITGHHAWLIDVYREAIDRIHQAGSQATIENECKDCIFSQPSEVVEFFELLQRSKQVHFTYDVQNLWEMGTFPTMDVYKQLRPLIGYFHLKGGMSAEPQGELVWKSTLADASWPVQAMTEQVIRDKVSPVICLNSSHGTRKADYDYDQIIHRDWEFVQIFTPSSHPED